MIFSLLHDILWNKRYKNRTMNPREPATHSIPGTPRAFVTRWIRTGLQSFLWTQRINWWLFIYNSIFPCKKKQPFNSWSPASDNQLIPVVTIFYYLIWVVFFKKILTKAPKCDICGVFSSCSHIWVHFAFLTSFSFSVGSFRHHMMQKQWELILVRCFLAKKSLELASVLKLNWPCVSENSLKTSAPMKHWLPRTSWNTVLQYVLQYGESTGEIGTVFAEKN